MEHGVVTNRPKHGHSTLQWDVPMIQSVLQPLPCTIETYIVSKFSDVILI